MLPTIEIMMPTLSSQPTGGSHQAGGVPAFLAKLWKMVDDPSTDDMISWSPDGNSFIIHAQAAFTQTLLPNYYKHSNMSSFVRQLNMYDFHKVVGVDSGGLKSERQEEMEFQHRCFIRGRDDLLENIKRKVTTKSGAGAQFLPAVKSEQVSEVLTEVTLIKDKQEDLDSKLDTMKKENEALWREVITLRQKHQAQQKIVNKLIHFLVSMVQPRMGGPGTGPGAVKRRYPNQLAIEDTMETTAASKEIKLTAASVSSPVSMAPEVAGSELDYGPIISDVTNEAGSPSAVVQTQQQQEQPKLASFTLLNPVTAAKAKLSGKGQKFVTTVPVNRASKTATAPGAASMVTTSDTSTSVLNLDNIISEVTKEDPIPSTSMQVPQQQLPKRATVVMQPASASKLNSSGQKVTIVTPVTVEMPDTPEPPEKSEPLVYVTAVRPTPTATTTATPVAMAAVDPTLVNPSISVVTTTSKRNNSVVSPKKRLEQQPKLAITSAPALPVGSARPALLRELSKEDLDSEMNFTQDTLDNLREILSGHVSLEPNFVNSLFNPEEPLPSYVLPHSNPEPSKSDLFSSVPQLQLELSAGNVDASSSNPHDMEQPTLFQLADMEDNPGECVPSPSPPPVAVDNSMLNTPLVFQDEDPFMSSLKK